MQSISLLVLLGLPLAAGVLIPLLPQGLAMGPRWLALAAGLGQLLLGVSLIPALSADLPIALHQSWLPQLGLSLDLGVDGLSLPLVILAALITSLAVLATPSIRRGPVSISA
jgi:NAD(P)H-quinone oxidoreductase subunit 4